MHVRHTELPDSQAQDIKTLKSLAPFLWEYRGRVAFALGSLLFAKVANVGIPLVLKSIVDALGKNHAQLVLPLALVVVVTDWVWHRRAAVEAEMFMMRQQIIVLRRARPGRVPLLAADSIVLTWVCQLFPKARGALVIVRPDPVVRWHRAGSRRYWRWKSRPRWVCLPKT